MCGEPTLIPPSFLPLFLFSFLLSFSPPSLPSTYATNIFKPLFCARQYAVKDSDSLQIAFILGRGRKEGESALRTVEITDKEA